MNIVEELAEIIGTAGAVLYEGVGGKGAVGGNEIVPPAVRRRGTAADEQFKKLVKHGSRGGT